MTHDEIMTYLNLIERRLDAQAATLDTIQAAQRQSQEHNSLIEKYIRHLQTTYKAAIAADAAETRSVAQEAARIIESIYRQMQESGTVSEKLMDRLPALCTALEDATAQLQIMAREAVVTPAQ